MKTWAPKADDARKADLTHHIGYDLLGPVVQRWLLSLFQHLQFHDDGSTVALYCARAGVRIAELYDLFLAGRDLGGPDRRMLWISRLAVVKGVFGTPSAHARSVELLTREYRHQPLRDLVQGVMRQCPELLADIDLRDRSLDAHGHNFAGWLTVNGPVQRRVRDYLKASTAAFETEIDTLLSRHRRALLIDSGWQGTAQGLLAAAHPDMHWRGLYFGRILTQGHDPAIVPDCIGLMFEAERWDPQRPETAFVRHRHLIEALLEPDAPSIEDIRGGPAKTAVEAMVEACRTATPDPVTDALYLAVRSYVADHAGQSPARILAAHAAAMPELARMIVRPTAAEASVLAAKGRSADFGKPLMVPVVSDPAGGRAEDREGRIARALWTEGQIALEYPPATARELQDRANGSACDLRSAKPLLADGVHRPSPESPPASPSSPARRTGPCCCAVPRKAWAGKASPISSGPSSTTAAMPERLPRSCARHRSTRDACGWCRTRRARGWRPPPTPGSPPATASTS